MQRRDGLEIIVNPGVGTSAYTSGDQLGSSQTIPNAVLDTKGLSVLRSLLVIDDSDQKKDFDILIFNEQPTSLAADNAAFTLSDADANKLVGIVKVVAADYTSLDGNAVALKSLELLLQAKASSKFLYVACVARGTPTYGASALKFKMLLERY